MLICKLFNGEGGSEKVYALCAHFNVDNCGWPLIQKMIFKREHSRKYKDGLWLFR